VSDLGLADAVAAGDWLVHHRGLEPHDLVAYAESQRGRGARISRQAAHLVRSNLWSLRESRVRLLLVLAGLPEPAPNVWVGTDHERLAIGDMVYSTWKVIVEYDGFQHLDNRSQWERDIVRLGELADAGWVVIRVTNNQLRCPRQIILRVWRALVAGGYAAPAPVIDGQWSTLFE